MNRIPLYLLALIVAIANSPTNVFQICAWNVGTLEIEPWRSKRTAFVTQLRSLGAAFRSIFNACGGLPAAAALAIALILVVTVPDAHAASLVAMAPLSLKVYRQRDSDLKGEIAKAKKERAAIGETVLAEKRELTDDERKNFAAFGPAIEKLEASLSQNAEFLAAAEEANEADRNFEAGRIKPDADTEAARGAARGANLQVGASEDDKKAKLPGMFGRQLQAVRSIALREATDEDVKMAKMMAGPTGLNTDVPSDGGFIVAPDRSNTIIQRSYDTGVILSRIRRMPIGPNSNGMKFPAIDETSRADGSRYGGIASGWLGQGNGLTSGKPKFREMDMKLRKVGAFVYATDEQLADAMALEGWINTYLPLELQFRTEDAFINGDGSNKPLGAINSGAVLSVTRSTSGHITSDDFRAMYAKMWAPLRGNAVFLLDQSSEPDLDLLTIPIGTAGVLDPSFKAAGTTPGQKYPTYKGVPIITVEYCAQLGTAGDLVMVAFDEYLAIDKGGVDQAVSLHVAFLTDEAVYRFMYRVDGQLSWNASLTLKSTATVSAVVSLT